MSVKCNCQDWKENINKVNAGFGLSAIHGLGGYQGKVFKYCPWCGKKLMGIKCGYMDYVSQPD